MSGFGDDVLPCYAERYGTQGDEAGDVGGGEEDSTCISRV